MITKIETQEDVVGLLSVFNEVWGAETLSELIVSLQETTCLLYKTPEIAGYIFYGYDSRGFVEITDLGISAKFRNKGYGKKLVQYVCNLADTICLSVKVDNKAAQSIYTSVGFIPKYTVHNYYGVGNDGLRMEWSKKEV